jgi:hypothetical protein
VIAFSGVEKIGAGHVLDAFDCGDESLNRFIKRHALLSQLCLVMKDLKRLLK